MRVKLAEKDKIWLRGYCAALTAMEGGTPGFYAGAVFEASEAAGLTIRLAKSIGVEEFDLKTLRAAGVKR